MRVPNLLFSVANSALDIFH